MGLKGRIFHIRLTQENRFNEIAARYKGLAGAVLIKFLLENQLCKSDEEIDRIILSQIKGEKTSSLKTTPRLKDNVAF